MSGSPAPRQCSRGLSAVQNAGSTNGLAHDRLPLEHRVSMTDVDRLVLTRGYERLLAAAGTLTGPDSLSVRCRSHRITMPNLYAVKILRTSRTWSAYQPVMRRGTNVVNRTGLGESSVLRGCLTHVTSLQPWCRRAIGAVVAERCPSWIVR
jgi:hypothetical protein